MTSKERSELLALLDFERQSVIYPGVTRTSEDGIVRDTRDDGRSVDIVYSSCTEDEVDQVIARQVEAAKADGQDVEWKLYGHDRPACLADRLVAGGFGPEPVEQLMVLRITEQSIKAFGEKINSVRRAGVEDLQDVQTILDEATETDRSAEVERYRSVLETQPERLSVYIGYADDGEPASCGRVYFHPDSQFAGLFGGNTRVRFRNRGLFLRVVSARLHEALNRGVPYACVDALPTSEPILRKRGFEVLTYTQPYTISFREPD